MPIDDRESLENNGGTERLEVPKGFVLGREDEADFYAHKKKQHQQQLTLMIMGVVAVGVITLGFLQLRGLLAVPMPKTNSSGAQQVAQESATPSGDLSQQDIATLKKQDTDGDGLSDYDELYIYNTSPYLADSDSDNVSDFDEVKAGTNPNCPQGQTCFQAAQQPSATVANSGTTSTTDSGGVQITAAQLRQLLVKSGKVTQAQADALTDDDLNQLYQEMLKENPSLSSSLQNAQTTTSTATPTVAQIKQMLIDQGMDAATVNQVDDATLMSLYQQAMQEASTQQ